jgi:GT2 family glycosyltransferase
LKPSRCTTTPEPVISVVIPVRDGAASLGRLLDSLAGQELDGERYEIVVVDNASRDATAEVAAARGARVVHEPIPNRSRARNAGVAAARADLIAFTDADCTASPQWLAALVECRGRAPLVAGPVNIRTRTPANAVERFEAASRFGQQAWVRQGWAATANLMVERSAFEAIGGLDPAYRHIGEDVDFCLRAGRAGFALGYCESAVIHHAAEHEVGAVLRRAFFNGYSAAQVLRRIGKGHVAWRDPKPLLSPRAAAAFHGISRDGLPRAERRAQMALASAAYASRVAGSVWSGVRRAR